jgi:SH3-like domain-containing protein
VSTKARNALSGALSIAVALPVAAADFRATADPAAILYDAPSARARPLFVYGRDVPVETLVSVEGWTKIRDAAGTIGWLQSKSLSDKRMVVVRTPTAEVRATAEEGAPVVFRAERDVLLELAEPAASAATTAMPGWLKVRHRDGQTGYIRLSQVFGF